MIYFNIAMFGLAIYFTSLFFKFSRIVHEKEDGGKLYINKIDILRRPNMLHAFMFGFFTFLIYWVFI